MVVEERAVGTVVVVQGLWRWRRPAGAAIVAICSCSQVWNNEPKPPSSQMPSLKSKCLYMLHHVGRQGHEKQMVNRHSEFIVWQPCALPSVGRSR